MLLCLVLSGQHLTHATEEEGKKSDLRKDLPTYRFQTPHIRQWLVLGPIPREHQPERSVILASLRTTKPLRIGGKDYDWHAVSSGDRGKVDLETFSNDRGGPVSNVCCYAACRMLANSDSPRNYWIGADDEVDVWIGDNEPAQLRGPNWFYWATLQGNRSIPAGHDETLCLVKAQNLNGSYSFSVSCGEEVHGVVNHWDGVTPLGPVGLELAAPTGEVFARHTALENGKFRLRPIPYEGDYRIRVATSEYAVKQLKDENGGRYIIAKATEPTPDVRRKLLPRSKLPHTKVTAIAQDGFGNIYFIKHGDHRIHQLSGGRLRSSAPFDTTGLGNVRQLIVNEAGRMLLLSDRCGLVVYNSSAPSFCYGPADATVGEFRQTAESVSSVISFAECPDGGCWLGVAIGDHSTSSDDQEELDESTYELHRISASGELLERVECDNAIVSVAVAEEKIYAATRYGEIFELSFGSTEPILLPDVPKTYICQLKLLPDENLQIIGGESTFTRQHDGSWYESVFRINRTSHPTTTSILTTPLTSDQAPLQYAVHPPSLYRFSHGNWTTNTVAKKISCIAPSISGGVLCGMEDGSIEEYSPRNYDVWGPRNGLSAASARKIAVYGTTLILGSLDSKPDRIFPDKTTAPVDGTLPGLPYARADGSLLFVPHLTSHDGKVASRANAYQISPSGRVRSIAPLGTWKHVVNALTETKDRELIVATNFGLFTLNEALRFVELKDQNGTQVLAENDVSAIWQTSDGEIWAACAGKGIGTIDLSSGRFDLCGELTSPRILTIAETAPNQLMFGTALGVYILDRRKNKLEKLDHPTLADQWVQEVLSGPDGATYIACQAGQVMRYKDDCLVPLVDIPEISGSNLWDIDFSSDGSLLLATTHGLVRYRSQKRMPRIWLKSVDAPSLSTAIPEANWTISPTSGTSPSYKIEEGEKVRISLGKWGPDGIASFRYREPGEPWQYVDSGASSFEFRLSTLRERSMEVQAIDRDHNYSAIHSLDFVPFLPWYRWVSTRVAATLLLLTGLVAIVTLRVGASRAQKRQMLAERIARETAEENVAERERLLHRVSHDLRNPLFVIAGCAEMMDAGQLDQESALPILNETVDSMTYLARQLLSYSRAKSSRPHSEHSLTCVRRLLQSVRDEAYVTKRGDKVDFHVEVAKGAPTTIKVPAQLLKEIMHNLTSNAIKNTSEGQIVIHYGLVDGKPTFRVADSGCGMSEETIDNLFKPFFKQQSSAPSSGFGLGLSICKSLADEIPAEISLQSEVEHGTVVTLTLANSTLIEDGEEIDESKLEPVLEGMQAGASMIPRSPDATKPIPYRVDGVLVDDLRFVRDVLERRLASIDVTVFECTSTSLPDLERLRPKFLLTDLEMPVSSGFDLARRVKNQHPEITIIAISEREDLLEKARLCPDFDCVLTKVSLLTNSKETMDFFRQFADPSPQEHGVPSPNLATTAGRQPSGHTTG
ncbi:MAG: hypothetical protein Aurels2KO_33720 [Aureliella sp.]